MSAVPAASARPNVATSIAIVGVLFFLIGFRNRIVVLLNWAVAYWSYQRSARIIFGDDRDDRRPKR